MNLKIDSVLFSIFYFYGYSSSNSNIPLLNVAANAFAANANNSGNAIINNTQNAPGPPSKDPKVFTFLFVSLNNLFC